MKAEELSPIIFTIFQLCWALIWALKHIHIRGRRRYAQMRAEADSNRRYKLISYFLYLAQNLLCLASFWSDAHVLLKIHDSDWVRLVGLTLVSLATVLYFSSLTYLGRNYSPCFDSHVPFELISAGPYKVMRHPMYLAKLLIVMGDFVLSGSLWFAPVLIYLLLETAGTIVREEEYLARTVPGYVGYQKGTRRLIPYVL
jgi:protein-S-isoprenylcysteine O-methyltransferase Ste14